MKKESAKEMLGEDGGNKGGGLRRYNSQMVIGPGTESQRQDDQIPGLRRIQT